MAKQQRWEMAWEFFIGEFTGNGPVFKKRSGGYNHKYAERARRERYAFFQNIIRVCDDFGIAVLKHQNLGTSHDAKGEEFPVAGTWDDSGVKINLLWQSAPVLAHEFTHGMDYLVHGPSRPARRELVACAGGYLLMCHYTGFCSPRGDVAYAKRQGATSVTLARVRDYIPRLFCQMTELIDSANREGG